MVCAESHCTTMSKPLTRAACLTPSGSAAVATIAVVGPDAWSIVASAFRGSLPKIPDVRRHWIGEFGAPPGDPVVMSIRQAEPTPWVEIHCHGGIQVVRWILSELKSHGVSESSWQELVGACSLSPLRSSAARELPHAVTVRTASILLDQFYGALDAELNAILALLSNNQVEQASTRLAELLKYSQVGRHLVVPWRIVVAGAPNVGKSSLINRLVGFPRCVVTPTAGTTRDLVATSIAIDGWPIELIDTAGQRTSADPLESAGVALANDVVQSADLALWLFDRPSPKVPFPCLMVRNKIDATPPKNLDAGVIPISALTGEGLDQLLAGIARRLVPSEPSAGAAVPFNSEISDQIEHAANRLAFENVTQCVAILNRLVQGG